MPATLLALPLVRRRHVASWQMTTGIQVMNPGDAPAQVELALQPSDAASLEPCGPGCSATIPPLGTHTFYPGANGLNFMPPGSWGQGRLSSDRPILAIVNDWSETMGMDMSTYTALPCGGEGPTVVVLP